MRLALGLNQNNVAYVVSLVTPYKLNQAMPHAWPGCFVVYSLHALSQAY